jgi:hypothetical protein
MSESSSNREKAPHCAAFVKAMREVFGEEHVQVLYVKEGDVELGRPDKAEYAVAHPASFRKNASPGRNAKASKETA